MLVVNGKQGLRLVSQADHARIAGSIAEEWGNPDFDPPARRDSAVLAANLHDEGWVEPDTLPLLNEATNRPLNFVEIDLRQHADFYGRAVEMVLEKDPYTAALISMHWTGLYVGRWGWQSNLAFDPPAELRDFLDGVVREQEIQWVEMKSRAWDPSEQRSTFEQNIWRNYELLQVWDILSLFVCRTDLSTKAEDVITAVPTRGGSQPTDLTVKTSGASDITVDPYPFSADSFELEIPVWEIADQDYPDQTAIRMEMDEKGQGFVKCRIRKP